MFFMLITTKNTNNVLLSYFNSFTQLIKLMSLQQLTWMELSETLKLPKCEKAIINPKQDTKC